MSAHFHTAVSPRDVVAEVARARPDTGATSRERGAGRGPASAAARRARRRTPLAGSVLLAIAIALVALNLRPAVTSLSSVLDAIHSSLGVSATWASVATMLPPLCFAAASGLAPWVHRRLGMAGAVSLAMLVLAVGCAVRAVDGPVVVLLGTFLASVAIAVGNVLLPVVVKDSFPLRVGLMTGIYTAMLQAGGAIGASITPALVPLLGGWRAALLSWGLLAAAALLLWLAAARHRRDEPADPDAPDDGPAPDGASALEGRSASNGGSGGSEYPEDALLPTVEPAGEPAPGRSLLRSRVAWQVTILFGLQSFLAYAVMGWLPQVFLDAGLSRQNAGLLLGLVAVVAFPVSLVVPPIAARQRSQSAWVSGLAAVGIIGIVGLALAPAAAPVFWSLALGIGMSVFSLVLMLISLRSRTSADTARLSAMAQSIGYLIACTGPLLFGLLHGFTGGWLVPFALLLATLLLQIVFGALAGRDRYV